MKVLIVDDIQDNRVLLRGMLESRNYQVEEANNGVQALELAQAEPPNLIVSDILMPEMDGFVLCRVLKGIEKLRHIPLVFYTATYLDKEDKELGLAIGAARYIQKPIEPLKFLQYIDEVLAKHPEDELSTPDLAIDNEIKFETLHQARIVNKLDQKVRDVNRLQLEQSTILASAKEGILCLNPEGNFTLINRSAASQLGYLADELRGRNGHSIWYHKLANGTPYPETDCRICESMKTGIAIEQIEGLFWRKDGTCFPAEYSSSPLLIEGISQGTVVVFRDISERKKAETEKKILEEELFQAQKMEAIGTLAGGVAHDFNNILTVIRGHAQLGMMQTTNENPLWNDLVEIEAAGDRAANLTQQLLAFSRKQTITPKLILINYLVNNLSKMLKRLIGEDLNLKFELGEELSPILADPGQMEQIIINLIVNAADAIKEQPLVSGRDITISTSEVLLDNNFVKTHEESKPGRHLMLKVADNGCGIAKEVLEHIFEPFFTTKEVGKGTGLGLSTVYGIVKQNNASIYVESEPGQGTTFKIYWPKAKNDAPQIIKNEVPKMPLGGSEVILLVEDEESTRNFARTVLQRAGYSVIETDNGLEALEKAKELQGSIDLVFTDIVMPKMGGKELSEKLSNIYPQIKFLFTSGYLSDRVDRDDKIFTDGRFIDKPYDIPVVLSKIRQLLDSR